MEGIVYLEACSKAEIGLVITIPIHSQNFLNSSFYEPFGGLIMTFMKTGVILS